MKKKGSYFLRIFPITVKLKAIFISSIICTANEMFYDKILYSQPVGT